MVKCKTIVRTILKFILERPSYQFVRLNVKLNFGQFRQSETCQFNRNCLPCLIRKVVDFVRLCACLNARAWHAIICLTRHPESIVSASTQYLSGTSKNAYILTSLVYYLPVGDEMETLLLSISVYHEIYILGECKWILMLLGFKGMRRERWSTAWMWRDGFHVWRRRMRSKNAKVQKRRCIATESPPLLIVFILEGFCFCIWYLRKQFQTGFLSWLLASMWNSAGPS